MTSSNAESARGFVGGPRREPDLRAHRHLGALDECGIRGSAGAAQPASIIADESPTAMIGMPAAAHGTIVT